MELTKCYKVKTNYPKSVKTEVENVENFLIKLIVEVKRILYLTRKFVYNMKAASAFFFVFLGN